MIWKNLCITNYDDCNADEFPLLIPDSSFNGLPLDDKLKEEILMKNKFIFCYTLSLYHLIYVWHWFEKRFPPHVFLNNYEADTWIVDTIWVDGCCCLLGFVGLHVLIYVCGIFLSVSLSVVSVVVVAVVVEAVVVIAVVIVIVIIALAVAVVIVSTSNQLY